ncbi:conserved exported hypothetical protein [uncultured Alphaproteobacteria bacterium]|uniref:DUF4139 domain-containing protein n=1 Tax=uncultured Alphaproteobacteria bacterium TaxID=91750 RepID=A0A212J9Y4_9PROT|nr:conserved exported hypothetical protein [uncultured Alphaproteobacteria bacterium]
MRMRNVLGSAVVAALAAAAAAPAGAAEERLWGGETLEARVLTVYADGFAQIEETRIGDVPKGTLRLRIGDVASGIVPESAILRGDRVAVKDMSIRPSLIDPHALMVGALGKTVKAVRTDPRTGEDKSENATLLVIDPRPILRIGDRIEVNYPGRVVLPATPDTPMPGSAQLDFGLESGVAGKRPLTLQYLLPGMRWQADYAALYDEAKGQITLNGWIGVSNGSDDSFRDVRLRVVAGNVARVTDPGDVVAFRAKAAMVDEAMRPQAITGYRLYPVSKSVSIEAGERKQVAFLDRAAIPVKRSYRVVDPVGVFRSAPAYWPRRGAFLRLAFDNLAAGTDPTPPMPAGVMRVMAYRPTEADLFLGEDRIDHTPEGGEVVAQLGRVVDVGYEASRLEYRDLSRNASEQRFSITLFNDGERPAEIEVAQTFPGQWTIFEEDATHSNRDSQTAVWKAVVEPKQRTSITFWVRITTGS